MRRIVLGASALILTATGLVGCGAQDCAPNEVRSEDYGCIEKDDLDLNDDGSFEDEEGEWDDD